MKRCFDRASSRSSDSALHKPPMLSLVAISESHNNQIPAADMLNWIGYKCCRKKDLAHSGATCSTLSVLRACFQETEPTSQEAPALHPEVVVNLAAEEQELEDDSNSLAASKRRFLEQKTFFLHRKPKSDSSKGQTSHQVQPTKQKMPETPKTPKDVPAASKQQLASKPAKVSSLVQEEDGLTQLLREEDSSKVSTTSALAAKSPTGNLQRKNSTAVLLETEAKAFEQFLNGDESEGSARPQLAKEKTSEVGNKNEKQKAHEISLAAWSSYFSKPENLENSPLKPDRAEEHQATVHTHSK